MAGGRRSGSARSRKRQNSEEASSEGTEYNLTSCPNCDRADCDDVIPDRALWWIITLWDGKVLMDNIFDFLGLLWLLKLIWGFAFPPFLVVWFLKCLCRFFSIIELLEENVPFFLFCEYMIPFFAVVGGLLHFFWSFLAPIPSCQISFYMSLRLSWILLYDLLANPAPGAEVWWEVVAQLAFFTFLLLSTVSSDKRPLKHEDIALIKDFGGCDCSSRRNHVHSEAEGSSLWAFESQVREDLLDVLPAFHLLQSGVGFDDLPQHCKMKVLNFLQKEIKNGKKRLEYRSSPVCHDCSSSQGTSGANINKQEIVSESRIKHQELGEISVQVLEVTHQVQDSNFDTSFDSSDCDSTDLENVLEAGEEGPVLPSTVVNKKSTSSSNESIQAVPEANGDNELENLAKTVKTFELDQVNQSGYSKDMFENFKFKKNTMTNQNETEDVLPTRKIEGCQLSDPVEDVTGKGYKMEKSGRRKRKDRGGRMCGRKACQEKGIQLCSRCKSISYCSVACSEIYWPEHRTSCSKEKEKKELRRRKKEKMATEVD